MRAGALDRRIEIQSYSATRDAIGGEVRFWTTTATVWAQKRDTAGRESEKAGREALAEVETVWRIRYCAGVSPKMRVKFGSQLWSIEAIAEIGRREGLDLRCLGVVA